MESIKNVSQILICTQADSYSAGTIADLANGELAVALPNGVLVNANAYSNLSAGDKYIIAVRGITSGILFTSDVLVKGQEVSQSNVAYSASQGQIDYIGFNGTDGAFEVINSNVYTVRLYVNDNTSASFRRALIKEGFFKSDAGATQEEIAAGLVTSLIKNFSRESEPLILFERVNAGVSTATSGGTIAVTQGSKYVSIAGTGADAGKYNADASDIVAGDYLRIGHATTNTFPVYRVDQVVSGGGATTMIVKLDVEYQGTSNAAIAAASVGVIPKATALAAAFGLKLTGQKRTFQKGVFNSDSYVTWVATLQDAGTTGITLSQTQSKGTGTPEWVIEREYEWQMNNYMYRIAQPTPSYHQDGATASTYSVWTIQYKDAMDTPLGGKADSYKTLYVACVTAGKTNVGTALGNAAV
jgi:hypothetical protein